MKCNVIWIDENIESEEKKENIKILDSFGAFAIRLFTNVDKAIDHMKYIEFQETKVIISDKLYHEFLQKFKENIIDMCVAPKIIILTKNKQNFMINNKDYQHKTFYNFGGVTDSFQEIVDYLFDDNKSEKIKNFDDVQLTFEYIDSKEKLVLPLLFKVLIDDISDNNTTEFTSYLYEKYSKNNDEIKNLLGSIKNISDIPIEILSKYYARLYTFESDFYKNINKDLGLNKVEKYLTFIKTLYEGVKLRSLPLANNNILYRGSRISNEEIKNIKEYINKKKEGLPSSIVFSKSFLSFSKDKKVADKFLKPKNKDKNLSKVLFILEKDNNYDYNLCTHGDIEKISYMPNEREVLFFPFSSFEIKDIKETKIGNENGYEIKLLYLGKYLKDIENDKNIIVNENKIPDTEFKKQLYETGLIEIEKIENINAKELYDNYKHNRNLISGEIYIKPNDINKRIRIINSFENFKREIGVENKEDDWKYENEKEIINNIEIKINGMINQFSYFYRFPREGKYNIQYSFKNYLTKTNHMFWGCNLLTNLDFSNFNSKNVTNMSHMFGGCNSLEKLNLFNFNTQKVTNMKDMFLCCSLLRNLNLSTFNTKNVTNMKGMFLCCYSLTNLDLLNFNTQNVSNMIGMFDGCNGLVRNNIITNDNRILTKFNNRKIGIIDLKNYF